MVAIDLEWREMHIGIVLDSGLRGYGIEKEWVVEFVIVVSDATKILIKTPQVYGS